jgi:3-hydroxy-D-aspartate aldolase
MPKLGARTICCVDDVDNVADLSAAAQKHGTEIECLVEIDCGAGRCGVTTTPEVVEIAKAIDAAPGPEVRRHPGLPGRDAAHGQLRGPQGQDRHRGRDGEGRRRHAEGRGARVRHRRRRRHRLLLFRVNSGVYNELQCGSYAFMDADYGRILDKDGKRIDQGEWENALFILTSVMSHAKADKAICDAGLKAQSVDSGLPVIFGRDDVEYVKCSDEHGVIADPDGVLKVNDKLRLVPGHCDPTCNVHDWYVGVRGGKVETVWPISARGKAY